MENMDVDFQNMLERIIPKQNQQQQIVRVPVASSLNRRPRD